MGDHVRDEGIVAPVPTEKSEGVWFKSILGSRTRAVLAAGSSTHLERELATVHDLPPLDRRDGIPDRASGDATIKQRSPFRVSTVKGMPPLLRRPAPVQSRASRRYLAIAVIAAVVMMCITWWLLA
jgi:hypothetical protein